MILEASVMTGICEMKATEEVGVEEMAEGTTEWKEGVRVADGEMDPLEMMVVVVVVAGDLVMAEEVVVPVLRVAHGKHLVQDLTVVVTGMKIMSAVHVAMSLKVAGQLCLDKGFVIYHYKNMVSNRI